MGERMGVWRVSQQPPYYKYWIICCRRLRLWPIGKNAVVACCSYWETTREPTNKFGRWRKCVGKQSSRLHSDIRKAMQIKLTVFHGLKTIKTTNWHKNRKYLRAVETYYIILIYRNLSNSSKSRKELPSKGWKLNWSSLDSLTSPDLSSTVSISVATGCSLDSNPSTKDSWQREQTTTRVQKWRH